jgi:pimeloyl-ACP methyl ester carboxylesterase
LNTWTADNKELWLRDFLPEDLATADVDFAPCSARIMTFGYDVKVYDQAASQRSETFAEDLLTALADRRMGVAVRHNPDFYPDVYRELIRSQAHRPIIFIGHSLGGIVIKKVSLSSSFPVCIVVLTKQASQALVLARLKSVLYDNIFLSVQHLMFFGTPHHGTNAGAEKLRSWGAFLARASPGSVLDELGLWSPWSIETNNRFAGIADRFTITTFREREKYRGVQVRQPPMPLKILMMFSGF